MKPVRFSVLELVMLEGLLCWAEAWIAVHEPWPYSVPLAGVIFALMMFAPLIVEAKR